MFKVINSDTKEWRHWDRSGVIAVNFEQCFIVFRSVPIDDFEQINTCWVCKENFEATAPVFSQQFHKSRFWITICVLTEMRTEHKKLST